MAGAGEYTISDWPDELFTVSRTTVVERSVCDCRRLPRSARSSVGRASLGYSKLCVPDEFAASRWSNS